MRETLQHSPIYIYKYTYTYTYTYIHIYEPILHVYVYPAATRQTQVLMQAENMCARAWKKAGALCKLSMSVVYT